LAELPQSGRARVGYVLKVYPRFSETFILTEVLAHERAGTELELFSLRHPVEGLFHEALAQVRAPVTYVPSEGIKAEHLWSELEAGLGELPGLAGALEAARGEGARDVHQAIYLARVARARGLTHLHAHFGSVATTVARLAARFAGRTYSFTAHAKDIFHQDVSPVDLERKLADAAAVITVSEHNLAHLSGLAPDGARIHRIYNGLDLDRFAYSSPAARAPRVVAVGRLIEKKGFEDLVEACAIMARGGRSFDCRIVGAGPLEGRLAAMISERGLEDRVVLLGPRSQVEMKAIVADAAAFAAPCVVGADGNRDGLPTVLLEAMALGTPCVSTDVTGIPEVLRDGETGIAVPQHDPAALAGALEALLDDGELRERLAVAARGLIEADFDAESTSARVREVFEACASESVPVSVNGAAGASRVRLR